MMFNPHFRQSHNHTFFVDEPLWSQPFNYTCFKYIQTSLWNLDFITIKHGKLTGLLQGAVVSVTLELPWLSHTIGIYYTLVIAGKKKAIENRYSE